MILPFVFPSVVELEVENNHDFILLVIMDGFYNNMNVILPILFAKL